jgi:hypothetical protein
MILILRGFNTHFGKGTIIGDQGHLAAGLTLSSIHFSSRWLKLSISFANRRYQRPMFKAKSKTLENQSVDLGIKLGQPFDDGAVATG